MVGKHSILEFAGTQISDAEDEDLHVQFGVTLEISRMDGQDIQVEGDKAFTKKNSSKILKHKFTVEEKQ